MCDRTQEEVLAREFAFEYYSGTSFAGQHPGELADKHWPKWKATAKRSLDILEKHEREKG
jgi:hypothetical protein